jgi:hypothetical protein
MRKKVVISLCIVLVIILLTGIYFTWFFKYTCKDLACFQARQETCSRTKFIRNTPTTTWEYNIKEKSKNTCIIEAKVLKVKEGQMDRKPFEQKSMECSVPLTSRVLPESDLSRCHGLLKEEIQQLIIRNAHSQILANIGKIREEFEKEEIRKVM